MRNLCQSFVNHRVADAPSLEAGYELFHGIALEPFQVFSETLPDVGADQGLIPGKNQQRGDALLEPPQKIAPRTALLRGIRNSIYER